MSVSLALGLALWAALCWNVSANCDYNKQCGVVLPVDPYVYIGNNLTLFCNLTKYDSTYNSRNLFFSRKNDDVIADKYVTITSTRSIMLKLPLTSPADGGMYICKLNRTGNEPKLIAEQFVIVDYEPVPVTEIDCRVYNWENMTCTWDLGVPYLHPNFLNITLVWVNSDYQFDCKHQTRTSCTWPSMGPDHFVPDEAYSMAVIIRNRATNITYPEKARVFVIRSAELVEPAPISSLRAESNSSCITLSWTHEKKRRDKIYRVNFRSEKDRHWKTKEVDDANHFVLCGLQPHVHYEFNISCKPRLAISRLVRGFWSKGVTISVLTDEDVPSVAPMMSPGSYVETPCQHYCKQLMLYWKPVSKDAANGNITYYRIDYRNVDTGSNWETASVTETQRLLILVSSDSYVIQLRAATRKGVSSVYREIFVPIKANKPAVPEHVVMAHNLSQETAITIKWNRPHIWTTSSWRNLTSYTVYWCRGYKIERRCQEPIQSQEVHISQTNVTLGVNMFETYMFGVAVNAETRTGEQISSGFKWNMCTYIRDTKPEVAISVRLPVYQPDDGLTLEWEGLTCSDTVAYIQQYVIYMCPAKRGQNCTGEISQFMVANTASTYTVDNLVEGSSFRIWMTALSEAGHGPDSTIMYYTVVNRTLKTEEIAGIAVALLFVLIVFLFGIILCFRRVFRTVKQKYFVPVPIEIPHTLPPLPPIPMPPRQLTPESESSDGIYEKIDGPPSPSSSTESTTGVEAPLIHHKWKLSTIKNQIYTKKKEQRHSNDSGRGSMSHSADTLLMRLHPSHFKRSRKPKKGNKSESDSGVIVGGRGQVNCYASGQSNTGDASDIEAQTVYDFGRTETKTKPAEVNPYSCVDIVDKINSERLNRKVNEDLLDTAPPVQNKYNGSTLSLPPGICKSHTPMSQPLCLKAKSTGNELDIEENKLCSMLEAKEFESSDIYSEDGTLDSIGDNEHETSESLNSQDGVGSSQTSSDSRLPINSYMKFLNGETMELSDEVFRRDQSQGPASCDCGCHSNTPTDISDGYVMATHTPENCGCEMAKDLGEGKYSELWQGDTPSARNKPRPSSFVHNLPPHFFSSLKSVTVDPATTTEL